MWTSWSQSHPEARFAIYEGQRGSLASVGQEPGPDFAALAVQWGGPFPGPHGESRPDLHLLGSVPTPSLPKWDGFRGRLCETEGSVLRVNTGSAYASGSREPSPGVQGPALRTPSPATLPSHRAHR